MAELHTICCGGCGMEYAVPKPWLDEKRENADSFNCPNGCPRTFKTSEADRQRQRAERAEQEIARLADEVEHQKRRVSAQFGENTKLRKRAANGVCPCCNRSFSNLRRHMHSKHPDFTENSSEATL